MKYSVLTYLFGDYEKLHEIQYIDDDIEYICVTDNKELTSNTWTIVYREFIPGVNSFDKVCYVRYHPFEFVHTDTVLKIDGSITVNGSLMKIFEDYTGNHSNLMIMVHPYDSLMVEEYAIWVDGRGYLANIANERMFYIYNILSYPSDTKGLVQLCLSMQTNDDANLLLNTQTYHIIREVNNFQCCDRLDQTLFTVVLNKYKDLFNITYIDQMLVTDGRYFKWHWHNDDETYVTERETMIEPYMFNKPVNITDF